MGHDYIDYRDRHIRLSDSDIWTLRHFFLHIANTSGPSDLGTDQETVDSLRCFIEAWQWLGPGVITGADLTEFVLDQPERVDVLLSLFRRTIECLNEIGDVIPLAYLQKHVNNEMAYYTEAQPTCRFIKLVQSLQKMVQGY